MQPPSSEHLITKQGRAAVRGRPGVADLLERHRWLATGAASGALGVTVMAALVFAGVSAGTALLIGGLVSAVCFLFFVVASWILGVPVVPELLEGENEPGEIEDELLFETEAQAGAEATRRNMQEGSTGAYWIEVELETGEWTVELRGRRRDRRGDSRDEGGRWSDWFGGEGGGGGDGGGGGGDGGGI